MNDLPDAVSPTAFYTRRFEEFSGKFAAANREKNRISTLRLTVVVAAVVAAVVLYRSHYGAASAGAAGAGAAVFFALVLYHAAVFRKAEEYEALVHVNRCGMLRCSGTWNALPDTGAEFIDKNHPYTADCDIFGKGSLYQYCSAAHTYTGRRMFADLLGGKERCRAGMVTMRQEAVAELAALPLWRQELECRGYRIPRDADPQPLVSWGETDEHMVRRKWYAAILLILQTATAVSAAALFFDVRAVFPALCTVSLQLALSAFLAPAHFRVFGIFGRQARNLDAYGQLVGHIAATNFTAALLAAQREVIAGNDGAERAVRRLARIVAASEARLSPLPWFFANTFFLWDMRCMLGLMSWRKRFGKRIATWFSAIGIFEAFSSCATIAFDNPGWIVPEVSDDKAALRGTGLGHPLLAAQERICNDFALGTCGDRVAIVTGSNMSGKSTFLRTLGSNLVLAYAGAPVCATSFSTGTFSLFTSMRTGDDLLSHTSTFYAELLRVKQIVDAVKRGDLPVLYLLDELFRGTNSADRHDGAVRLLDVLAQPHTLGCVATHDLELCSLADRSSAYRNYHFRERFDGDAIRFDYTLREGPSTTRNALFLMRMVGITDDADAGADDGVR